MERMVDQSGIFGVTFNVISAHCNFSETTQAEKVVDRAGKFEERNSSNAQINQNEGDFSPVQVSTAIDDRSGRPDDNQANKIQKPKKWRPRQNGATRCILRSRSGCKNSEKFLVDDELLLQASSHANSSHEASLEPIFERREDLGKHNVHTHFP